MVNKFALELTPQLDVWKSQDYGSEFVRVWEGERGRNIRGVDISCGREREKGIEGQ
jgi:hypothetical protein